MAKASKNAVPENAMEYSEHDKTYHLFLWLTKWMVIGCISLLLAMMVGFFGGGGLVGGALVFVVLMALMFFLV